ncbi:MAG: LacI family DNA-binding transcriptional regulator, partial [Catenulispora sp.]|nr:LacI family DNA-binding transcriptional regulator [Catenulispora sp.]
MAAPTLKDVAQRAGVSVRTVSNVVNGHVYVADETRRRVQAAIDALGYRPNLLARNLKQGRSAIIGLVVPELDVPYFAELARLIIAEAREHGYTVLIDQTDGDEERERELIGDNSRAVNFDGLIVSPLSLAVSDLRARRSDTPVVLLGERIFDSDADHVAIDNVLAAREATEHLIGLGRTRIAAVGVQQNSGTANLRARGFTEAFRRSGQTVDESLLVSTEHYHRADGARAMAELLDRDVVPDAVFCFSDLLALGALREALSRGLRVPEDLAIVGFDDIEDGRYSTPSLTTVAPDKVRLARFAVGQVLARIQGDQGASPREIITPHQLEVRESTAGKTAGAVGGG